MKKQIGKQTNFNILADLGMTNIYKIIHPPPNKLLPLNPFPKINPKLAFIGCDMTVN